MVARMKNFLILFFLSFSCVVLAQSSSIKSLEKQLAATKDKRKKLDLNYKIAQEYKGSDYKKAATYAGKAHALAVEIKDYPKMISTSMFAGDMYYKQKQYGAASTRYKSSADFSKKVKDYESVSKAYNKLVEIEKKKKNLRGALSYSQEAVSYLSKAKAGSSSSSSSTSSSPSRTRDNSELSKEKAKLENEKRNLQNEIAELEKAKKSFQSFKNKTKAERDKLRKEKRDVETSLSEIETEMASVAEKNEEVQSRIKFKESQIKALSREKLENQAMLDAKRAENAELGISIERSKNLRNLLLLLSAFIIALAILFFMRYRSKKKANEELEEKTKLIEEERQRSDELLLNILPAPIAKELKEKGKAKARKYESVTVLFSDFQNFSKISEQLTPEELVQELDHCFKAFDFIVSQYNIEKIKTIGDAYMCASGLTGRELTPIDIVKAALEMQEFLEDYKNQRKQNSQPFFEARIGLHTGPVVAGVVGVNKFAYDIWGDTVNVAARMEANSEVGRVNISESTYLKVKYDFECIHRGKIAAKNIGYIDMYFIIGPKTGTNTNYSTSSNSAV